jgi:hypothetical protein
MKKNKLVIVISCFFLILILSFFAYRYLYLEPTAKIIPGYVINYNTTENDFYNIDIASWRLEGSGIKKIQVNYICPGIYGNVWFEKRFDFSKFEYVWEPRDSEDGVEVIYNFLPDSEKGADNVLLVVPLPKGGDCKVTPFYYAIQG